MRAIAREAGLELPLDPPRLAFATIGGVIASNSQGPWSWGRRPLRDHVLGLNVVLPDGTKVRFGGHAIKNVAGFDLKKLMIGSHGCLGVTTEVVLKAMPLPEAQYASEVEGPVDVVTEICLLLRAPEINPAALLFVREAGSNRARLLVGFEGTIERWTSPG
ncbi:MAG: FAD-binding oxidoreductase [Firmicutes bacterium]|nr:FAD-binding oxidoreductase [Bacillota bacterium]